MVREPTTLTLFDFRLAGLGLIGSKMDGLSRSGPLSVIIGRYWLGADIRREPAERPVMTLSGHSLLPVGHAEQPSG